jgi:hypothetical protein
MTPATGGRGQEGWAGHRLSASSPAPDPEPAGLAGGAPVRISRAAAAVQDLLSSGRRVVIIEAALEYGRCGIGVFPLGNDGKRPFFAAQRACRARGCRGCEAFGHGFYDATTEPERLREMWRLADPEAGIAARLPGQIIVVDVDPRHGGLTWLATRPPLDPTLMVWSGRGDGGRHHYYLAPPGHVDPSALRGTGVDLKTHRGYVALPPTRHRSGGRYRWDRSVAVPQALPAWLAALCMDPTPHQRLVTHPDARANKAREREAAATAPGRSSSGSVGGRIGPATQYRQLLAVVRRAPQGHRNDRLFWAACRAGELITSGSLTWERASAGLVSAAVTAGLSLAEAEATVESGLRSAGTR